MMKTKTAKCERYHVWGTRGRYMARVMYRGRTLSYWQAGYCVWIQFPADDSDWTDIARKHAKEHGFTHIRFIGNFEHSATPKGGAL